MTKITISTILVLGTLSLFVKSWMATDDLVFNLAEEDIHLYL